MEENTYVLITAAHNEEKFIEYPLKSVVSQTIHPKEWIIVSDGSTDGTDEIVSHYSSQNEFIKLIRREGKNKGLDFSSKVLSINEAYRQIDKLEYDFLGILDGDVSFSSNYYEEVIERFIQNPRLGIAGGVIYDSHNGHCIRRSPDDNQYVSGCIQLFRRQCYKDIGGLHPIKEGGEDTIAVIMARMKGWDVELLEDLTVLHHKHSESARGLLRESYREGKLFYCLGSHPLFELIKSIRKLAVKPFILYSFARMYGYLLPYFLNQKRPITNDFVDFLRKDQLIRLKQELFKNGHFSQKR